MEDKQDGDAIEARTKKNVLLCCFRRKFHILGIIVMSAILWLFIYYKVLNHKFVLPGPLRELQKYFGDGDAKQRRRPSLLETFSEKANVTHIHTITRRSKVLHVAIAVCQKRVHEAITSLKSICIMTSSFLHFHIFASRKDFSTFDQELTRWPGWSEGWLDFETFPLQWGDYGRRWRLLVDRNDLCNHQFLFLPSILTDVRELLYVNTDTIFLRPPEHLWDSFSYFNTSQVAGFTYGVKPEKDSNIDRYKNMSLLEVRGLSTGVVLMNLTRIRKIKLEVSMLDHFDSISSDSDLHSAPSKLVSWFQNHTSTLYPLSCAWNYAPDNCMSGNNCRDAKQDGIFAVERSRTGWRRRARDAAFQWIQDAFASYKFGQNFNETIVWEVGEQLRRHHKPCGMMINSFLKYPKFLLS